MAPRLLAVTVLALWAGECQPAERASPSGSPEAGAVARGQEQLGVTDVAIGARHLCALLTDATVVCWGDNQKSQLGVGTRVESPNPVRVSGLRGVVAIAAGSETTCAVLKNGELRCWGANDDGIAGTSGEVALVPARVAPDSVERVALGRRYGCLIYARGSIACWGEYADRGSSSPTPVLAGEASSVIDFAAAGDHACVASGPAGQIRCWSNSRYDPAPKAPPLGPVSSVATSAQHTCAIASGKVLCWGSNGDGQLGVKDGEGPVTVPGIDGAKQVVALSGGGCALLERGDVRCWGRGAALDDGGAEVSKSVHGVERLRGAYGVACAITKAHALHCWGDNQNNQLRSKDPRESLQPVKVSGLAPVTRLASGGTQTCARLRDASVACFGAREYRAANDFRPAGVLDNAVHFAMGDGDLCVQTTSALFCRGSGYAGAIPILAEGDVGLEAVPLEHVAELSLGEHHGCARLDDGSIRCWAGGDDDRAKRGPTRLRKTTSMGISDATRVAVGVTESCALTKTGKVLCWGSVAPYQDGIVLDPTELPTGRRAPTELTLGPVTSIAHGRRSACAVLEGGGVACWGRNEYGQLGIGRRTAPQSEPVPVEIEDAVEVAVGAFHACARVRQGDVYCWGDNFYGQLGDGSKDDHLKPARVVGLAKASGLALGKRHSCAIDDAGDVWCWGDNRSRELGYGAPFATATPVEIDLSAVPAGRR